MAKKSESKQVAAEDRKRSAIRWFGRVVNVVAAFMIGMGAGALFRGRGETVHTVTLICAGVFLLVLEAAWENVVRESIEREELLRGINASNQEALFSLLEFVSKMADETGATVTVSIEGAEGEEL